MRKSFICWVGCLVAVSYTCGADGCKKGLCASGEWVPLERALDIHAGSALDLSGLPARHEPAGKFGRAEVTVRLPNPMKVYALGADGVRRNEVAAHYADGRMSFVADTASGAIYYEIIQLNFANF